MRSQDLKPYNKIFKQLKEDNDVATESVILGLKKEYEINHKIDSEILDRIISKNHTNCCCPKCGSITILRNGFTSRHRQRFICKNCNKRFVDTSKSLFYSSKVNINAWSSFIEGIVSETSVQSACFKAKITLPTAYYWMKKIFKSLEGYQNDIILKNKIYADETFISIEDSKMDRKDNNKNIVGYHTIKFVLRYF